MTPAKRVFDLVASGLGLAALAPVLGLVALVILARDGRPVFYRQVRIGRNGEPFRIRKFRTMRDAGTAAAPQVTAADDPRVTPLGKVLRRWKLDELPQLLNVLTGEMSIVGPRPEVPRFVACYSPEERALLRYVPGLTDPAALRYRDEERLLAGAADPEQLYAERIMPEKVRLSLDYARRATVLSDLGLIGATLLALGRRGDPGTVPPPVAIRAGRPSHGAS
ncbi:MAG TPA: sugar transferase [Gemmatimonadales bacterium]|nr:sugar transferase [Gemmatimonadales bacterium]